MISFRASVLVIVAVLVAGAVSIPFVEINNSPETYAPSDMRVSVLNKEMREHFPSDEIFYFLFQAPDIYTPDFLKRLKSFSEDVGEHEKVNNVRSIMTLERVYNDGNDLVIEEMVTNDDLENFKLEELQNKLSEDRFIWGILANKKSLGLIVETIDADTSDDRLELEAFIEEKFEEYHLKEAYQGASGFIPVDLAEYRSMFQDSLALIPLSIMLGMLAMWLLFHKWIPLVIIGLTALMASAMIYLFFVIFQLPYNLVGVMLPTLMNALVTAALVHVFVSMRTLGSKYKGEELVRQAVKKVYKPIFFSMLTTSIGLVSLATGPIPPIQYFGWVGAIILMLLCLVILHVMPAIIIRFDRGGWDLPQSKSWSVEGLVSRVSDLSIKYRKYFFAFTIVIVIFSAMKIPDLSVQTNFLKFFKADHPVNIGTNKIEKEFVGTTSFLLYLKSQEVEGLKREAVIDNLRKLKRDLVNHPKIDQAFSLADFLEEIDKSYGGQGEAYLTQNLIDQYLVVYDGNDMFDFVNRAMNRGRIVLNVREHSTDKIKVVISDIERIVESYNWPEGIEVQLGGVGKMMSDLQDLTIKGQVNSIGAALIFILVLLSILWKSVPEALLSMIPNIIPVIITFAVMALVGIPLDMGTVLIASITVGIAIDDSIHLFYNIRDQVFKKKNKLEGVIEGVKITGAPILITTTVLCAQFAVFAFSDFVPTVYFSVLSLTGLISAVLFDLFLFPGVLVQFWKPKLEK